MDRLDAAIGIDGWQDQYELLPDGSVVCKLRVRIGNWIEKTNIGGQSEQKDEHDKHKAARYINGDRTVLLLDHQDNRCKMRSLGEVVRPQA